MIANFFKLLFFLIPLVFYKNTSEIFEFNKIIILYIFTILIVTLWIIKSIRYRKIIFSRTILDIPLVLNLSAYLLSTLFSIDKHVSIFGYYSRFNGGLLSALSYTLLYWAFVSNLTKKESIKIICYALFSTTIASILAILEHYGISFTCSLMGFGWGNSCWIQDVQSRVYSTFGQPNWLAAALVVFLPISWDFMLKPKGFNFKSVAWVIMSTLLFVTLLFTKSRSGLLAFGIESIFYWGFIFSKSRFKNWKYFLTINLTFIAFLLIFNPLNFNHQVPIVTTSQGTSLEQGGTDSGSIRKLVWQGAINIWHHYPILGTGVETYAFAFPMFKPVEHNLTSEWDFIYNKAHNEYLNYLATTGVLGIFSYFVLIGFSLFILLKNLKNNGNKNSWTPGLFAAYLSILTTNFFGFSVVYISLLFYLLPAMSIVKNSEPTMLDKSKKLFSHQYIAICSLISVMFYLLLCVIKYWNSDVYYNKAKLSEKSGDIIIARQNIEKAINLNPYESVFFSEASVIDANLAVELLNQKEKEKAEEFKNYSISEAEKAIKMSHYNMNIKKNTVVNLSRLAVFDQVYYQKAIDILNSAISISPNDPKIRYQIGLLYLKVDRQQEGYEKLQNAVELKPNYKEGRFALGVTYQDLGENEKAKEQFEYILQKIDPNDELTKKYLEEVN